MSIHNSRQISDVKILLKTGVDGAGIANIEKTSTSGLVDTYTITLTSGTKYTFTVTNGKGINSVEKTGTSGLVDTYTITFDDGSTETFNVTNGNGISSIEKTQTVGLVDTYTITFTNGTTTTFDVTNGSGGGLDPHIVITSDHGSTVTLTHGSNVITAIETSNGYFETDVPEYGTWQIDSVLGGDTVTKTLVVDTAKVYIVDASHFSASITVTYPSGATCTCVGGSESYTATNNPETFTVHSADTFTITATDGTNTRTQTVTISTSGQTESVTLSFVPDGATVTPVGDIQTWLHCADIWDKSYTTLTEVLADSTTLSSLIADSNAVDYMVRSTTWATDVCSNQSAMSYIGLDDYCADTLLEDSTWLNAICNSTYFESVLNVKVPTMTSNTNPSGTVSASIDNSNAYKAFDGNDSTKWTNSSMSQGSTCNVQYEFTNAMKAYFFKAIAGHSGYISYVPQIKVTVVGSNDGVTWSEPLIEKSFNMTVALNYPLSDLLDNMDSDYSIYKISFELPTTSGYRPEFYVNTFQIYGRASS